MCGSRSGLLTQVAENPARHVLRAAQQPVDVDERQANAVAARIELDLRIGASLTRLQTLSLQTMGPQLQDLILSYGTSSTQGADPPLTLTGSCQFPTLGFVVDRYFRVKNFAPETFWGIKVVHIRGDISVTFGWDRHHLFDRMAVAILFERCIIAKKAEVTKVQDKPTSKWRPLPLTTLEMQQKGTQYLRMDSQRVMKVDKAGCVDTTIC